MKIFNVSYLKKARTKQNHWVKIGIAFQDVSTNRINIELDTVPCLVGPEN